jgi:hypothetical protein
MLESDINKYNDIPSFAPILNHRITDKIQSGINRMQEMKDAKKRILNNKTQITIPNCIKLLLQKIKHTREKVEELFDFNNDNLCVYENMRMKICQVNLNLNTMSYNNTIIQILLIKDINYSLDKDISLSMNTKGHIYIFLTQKNIPIYIYIYGTYCMYILYVLGIFYVYYGAYALNIKY